MGGLSIMIGTFPSVIYRANQRHIVATIDKKNTIDIGFIILVFMFF